MEEDISTVILVQEELLKTILKADKNFKKTPKDRLKQPYIETRLQTLEQYWKEFRDGHRKIVTLASEEEKKSDTYFTEGLSEQCEECYVDYKSSLLEHLAAFTKKQTVNIKDVGEATSQALHQLNTESTSYEVRLPYVQLPTFTGKYEEWQTFYDMFLSLIHTNTSLSPVQKLQYLKSNVSGEPQLLLRNFSTTDLNYEEAWSQLVRRYNNKRYNCNTVLRNLLAQKKIPIEGANAIKQLLDTTTSCLLSLKNMGVQTETWDVIIVHIVLSKLDNESIKQWEQQFSSTSDLPTWLDLRNYLESRFRSLEMIDTSSVRPLAQVKPTTTARPKVFHVSGETGKSKLSCVMCQGDHFIYHCKQFGLLTAKERQDFIQRSKLCFNCLAPTHAAYKCRQSACCKKCGRRHHTLLHFDKVTTTETAHSSKSQSLQLQPSTREETQVVVNLSRKNFGSVLLATAKVRACNKINNCKQVIRALIDQGSQASFVTEETVQLLGLVRQPVNGWVSGLGNGRSKIKYMVSFDIQSCHNPNISVKINAFVLNTVTTVLPATNLEPPEWLEIINLPLADNTYTTSGKIDVLLGAEVHSEILLDGIIKHPTRNIIAQNTLFGWILSGQVSLKSELDIHTEIISTHIHINTENEILKQFWEMENEPNTLQRELTKSEKKCEDIYEKTTKRDNQGRYIVTLPFSTDTPQCVNNNSRDIAIKRLHLLERRLSKNPELRVEYNKIMQEYLTMNHMVLVESEDDREAVYLPHHCVVREDKITTKVRVVFDGSCKGNNDVSLNDELLVGPKLQQDLRHILMRWRLHKIVILADIIKMYRMVLVHDKDTDFQRIVWRFHPDEPIQDYKLLRLTFGTACAPYLAVKTIQQLAQDEENNYPVAANIAKYDFYMDDLMTGCETIDEAILIYEQMNKLMNAGGFYLQKWNSNNNEFFKQTEIQNKCLSEDTFAIKMNNPMKVLGVVWNRELDGFEYKITLNNNKEYTKRQVVSDVARLFDPLGWIAPVVIKAKIYIQQLWKANIQWDDVISENLLKEWLIYRESFVDLQSIKIPRWHNYTKNNKIELHTFSDASKAAFAAAVYIRVTDKNNKVYVSLMTAKTKVAPLKEISIPRLELCGAVLAAKLVYEVSQILNVPKENIHGWTDSTIVLAWLKGGSSRWSTFVSNRVTTILNILEYRQWGHVTSETNPADCASRGLAPKDLINNSLWWSGPLWLTEGVIPEYAVEDTNEEERVVSLTVSPVVEQEFIWLKFSSLSKLLRVISYCRRFLKFKLPKDKRISFPNFITTDELKNTLQFCIKQIQAYEFKEEIEQLKSRGCVSKRSNLRTLYPFIDDKEIVRVGGRITQSDVAYDTKHPIIMPAKNHFSKLLILDAHHRTLHGGPQIMLNFLRSKYWIINSKPQVKGVFRDCVICRRHKSSKQSVQLMGQIPNVRLMPSKPFKNTGVDYAGPINIRFSPGRGAKSYKGYICLFICMVTRAIHLEAVTDLSAKGFISAFRRFTSRRGHCQNLYSDNGTNFVGANKLLKEMFDKCKSSLPAEIAESLTLEGTTCHYIPPYGPNFGSLWESGIRNTKTHLHKVIGTHTLTYEELSTVLAQVEACLNSRPISVLSDNPNDPLPLTPGHFLVGEPIINLAEDDYSKCNITGLDRWKLTQKIVRDFWNRWYKEYIIHLNQRFKWNSKQAEPNLGDVVVLKEDHVPPAKWVLGIIVNKFPGPDNLTRVVSVKCKNGVHKRPLSKICILYNNPV